MSIGNMKKEQVDSVLEDIKQKSGPKICKVKFQTLEPTATCQEDLDISLLGDVMTDMRVELGRAELTVREILQLDVGAIIELNKVAGEEVEVFINDMPFVSAEVVIINESFGIRVNSFLSVLEE